MNRIASLGIVLKEMIVNGKEYASQIIKNMVLPLNMPIEDLQKSSNTA